MLLICYFMLQSSVTCWRMLLKVLIRWNKSNNLSMNRFKSLSSFLIVLPSLKKEKKSQVLALQQCLKIPKTIKTTKFFPKLTDLLDYVT